MDANLDPGKLKSDDPKALVCGVDEAGRGCLAGPIFAAAVVLDPNSPIEGLADSKRLVESRRFALEGKIKRAALAYGIASASVYEIDRRGIEWSNRIAFTRAVRDLLRRFPNIDAQRLTVLIDGNRRAMRLGLRQRTVVGGDGLVPAIAAASILAKTARDRYVVEVMHRAFPQYAFDRHKGYATRAHLEQIAKWGPSPVHRVSFKFGQKGEGGRPGDLGAGRFLD